VKRATTQLATVLLIVSWAHTASAQTVDEIVEKTLTALGGRAALAKIKTRSAAGTITLSTPAGDVTGAIELLNAIPNKSRTLIKADLTSLGIGPLTVDQRFDGKSGYVLDSFQGNREISGNQLDNLRNSSFPHPLLNYKDVGTSAKLSGKEKVGDRDAFVVVFEPVSGSAVRQYIDAETYLPIKVVVKAEVPQLGQEMDQTNEFLDFRDVDGVKVPFQLKSTSNIQNFSIKLTKVEHNVAIDDALFSKPAAP
jgi:hypothetical protein